MVVIAGAGTSSTAGTVAKVGLLAALPIDGLLLVTPAYNRPAQEGLYQHFVAANSAAAGKPVLLYNVPARTAVDMLPATVARLSRVPGIVGVKEAVPELARVRELLDSCAPGFVVLSGDDATARESIRAGARGVISVTANVAPRQMSQMVAAALAGAHEQAQALDAALAAAAPGPVPRGEPDPGQVAAVADGADRLWGKIAADDPGGGVPGERAQGGTGRAGAALAHPRRERAFHEVTEVS